MQNILSSVKFAYTATAAGTATAAMETSAVDTAGYDTITFFRPTSAARVLHLVGGDSSTATVALANTYVTATAGSLVAIECHRPPYRYIKLASAEGTTSVFGDCVSILSNPRSLPVSNAADLTVATPTAA